MNTEKKSRLRNAFARVKESFKRFWRAVKEIVLGAETLPEGTPILRKVGVISTGIVVLLMTTVILPFMFLGDKFDKLRDIIMDFEVPATDEVDAPQEA